MIQRILLSLFLLTVSLSAQRQTMPIASGDPPRFTVKTWRIYYGDGTMVTCACGGGVRNSLAQWYTAPQRGVQAVSVIFNETYRTYRNGTWYVIPYRKLFHGARGDADYYWFNGTEFGASNVLDLPSGLPDGALKLGTQIRDDLFKAIILGAQDDEIF